MTAQASTPCASVNSTTMKYGLCGKAHKYLKGKRCAQGTLGTHTRGQSHGVPVWETSTGNDVLKRCYPQLPRRPEHRIYNLRRDSPNICAGTRPHLRRDLQNERKIAHITEVEQEEPAGSNREKESNKQRSADKFPEPLMPQRQAARALARAKSGGRL